VAVINGKALKRLARKWWPIYSWSRLSRSDMDWCYLIWSSNIHSGRIISYKIKRSSSDAEYTWLG